MKLADIFWKAANEHLSLGWSDFEKSQFTCCAVSDAVSDSFQDHRRAYVLEEAWSFMEKLGCRIGRMNYTFGAKDIAERQQRRYMWLLIAMHAAEDEGIEV